VYKVAPETVFHVNVGVSETSKAPFVGKIIVGTAGGVHASVVKDQAAQKSLEPQELVAFTRQ
jgi:hypothetical protein